MQEWSDKPYACGLRKILFKIPGLSGNKVGLAMNKRLKNVIFFNISCFHGAMMTEMKVEYNVQHDRMNGANNGDVERNCF